MALASRSGGDLRRLLYAFFGFLNRRTDFYLVPNESDLRENVPVRMGFREGEAEKLLLAAFRQFPLRRMPRQRRPPPPKSDDDHVESSSQQRRSDVRAAEKKLESARLSDVANEETDVADDDQETKKSPDAVTVVDEDDDDAVRYTAEGKQIPVGNGGVARGGHRWTQTLNETSVVLRVPPNTRGRDWDVSIRPASVSVRQKDEKESGPLFAGDLVEAVHPDESTWSLEGAALLLTLDKVRPTWWDRVLKNDDDDDADAHDKHVIDTSLVDSTRKIGDYDEMTQGHIRKILFDQRQERLGLPTSDDILLRSGEKKTISGKKQWPPGVDYINKDKMDKVRDGKK